MESAFSTGGMVGHLSYLLLVISMLMRSLTRLRILVIASALVAITYDVVWLKDPVGVFWETLLVTVNVIQIFLIWRANRRSRFSAEERAFKSKRLTSLSLSDTRQLLDLGVWVNGLAGTFLTTEGEPVANLFYLSDGCAEIYSNGVSVGTCNPGNFVGEMSMLSGAPASATAVLLEPARYWVISQDRLRRLQQDRPHFLAAIEQGIARDLRNKIVSANASRSQDGDLI